MTRIFGAYTDIPWTSDKNGAFKVGQGNSFLFYWRHDQKFIKLRCINRKKEVYHSKDSLCCFGGMDLNVRNNCNIDYYSYSLLGECYKPDTKGQGAFCLAGSYNFKVLEIEVYKVL